MALSPEELDENYQTYPEFRFQVEREAYGISNDANFPYEIPNTKIEEAVFEQPAKPAQILPPVKKAA